MNYLKVYDALIHRAKNRVIKGYVEKHHIVPKCMGGSNAKENLVELTAREHLVCHILLAKIHGGKLWAAVNLMSNTKTLNSRRYEIYRKKFVEFISKPQTEEHIQNCKNTWTKARRDTHSRWLKANPIKKKRAWNKGKKCPNISGDKNGFYGKKHTAETRKRISQKSGHAPSEKQLKVLKSQTGSKNSNFKGYYHTPYGIFESTSHGVEACGVCSLTIFSRCKSENPKWKDWFVNGRI